jgi:hypothetical protein
LARSAVAVALGVRNALGVEGLAGEDDLAAAVEMAGARVRFYPGIRDLPGFQVARSIWLSDDLDDGMRRYVTAHELGHIRLAHGLSLYTSPLSLYQTREEADADAFAGAFFLGYPGGPKFDDAVEEWKDAGMPDSCFLRFLNAARPR